jgi:hypothetical protein
MPDTIDIWRAARELVRWRATEAPQLRRPEGGGGARRERLGVLARGRASGSIIAPDSAPFGDLEERLTAQMLRVRHTADKDMYHTMRLALSRLGHWRAGYHHPSKARADPFSG